MIFFFKLLGNAFDIFSNLIAILWLDKGYAVRLFIVGGKEKLLACISDAIAA